MTNVPPDPALAEAFPGVTPAGPRISFVDMHAGGEPLLIVMGDLGRGLLLR